MCVNLKLFNESFRKWAEKAQEDEDRYTFAWPQSEEQEELAKSYEQKEESKAEKGS